MRVRAAIHVTIPVRAANRVLRSPARAGGRLVQYIARGAARGDNGRVVSQS